MCFSASTISSQHCSASLYTGHLKLSSMFSPVSFPRSVLPPGRGGTAGRTTTLCGCAWQGPCPSPRPPRASASTASSRPQPCDRPGTPPPPPPPPPRGLQSPPVFTPKAPLCKLCSFVLADLSSVRGPSCFAGLSSPTSVMLL